MQLEWLSLRNHNSSSHIYWASLIAGSPVKLDCKRASCGHSWVVTLKIVTPLVFICMIALFIDQFIVQRSEHGKYFDILSFCSYPLAYL